MFNEMNKWEKAGLIIGTLECVAGFGIAIWANRKCKKAMEQATQNKIETPLDMIDEVMDRRSKELFGDED